MAPKDPRQLNAFANFSELVIPAPKGQDISAQAGALGFGENDTSKALKGRDKWRLIRISRIVSPFQGLRAH